MEQPPELGKANHSGDSSIFGRLHLRNIFHFSEVHGSMNAKGHVHWIRCVHTSINHRKMKLISYIYTLFLHRFCSLFVEFYLNLANKLRRKACYIPTCLFITFSSRHYDMTSIERYIGQSTIAFIYDVAYA